MLGVEDPVQYFLAGCKSACSSGKPDIGRIPTEHLRDVPAHLPRHRLSGERVLDGDQEGSPVVRLVDGNHITATKKDAGIGEIDGGGERRGSIKEQPCRIGSFAGV